MRKSFVEGLLRKSVPQSEVAARLRLNVPVLVYIRSVSIQYDKRNRGRDGFLLKCNTGHRDIY